MARTDRLCAKCRKSRTHARGLCASCYGLLRRAGGLRCLKCSSRSPASSHGLCQPCAKGRSAPKTVYRSKRREMVLEEFDFMREHGASLVEIADALGLKTESLQRSLMRYGRGWFKADA